MRRAARRTATAAREPHLAEHFAELGSRRLASFGVGNVINPRANVTGAGLISTNGSTTQTLTGSVAGGTTTTPTLAFGSIHEGESPSLGYAINNVASFGPVLRGAIQTSANGGNITDSRFGGAGVVAGNFAPIAVHGHGGSLTITFNATTPDTYRPDRPSDQ